MHLELALALGGGFQGMQGKSHLHDLEGPTPMQKNLHAKKTVTSRCRDATATAWKC